MKNLGLYLNLLTFKISTGIFIFQEGNDFKKDIKFIQNDCYIFISDADEIKVYQSHIEHLYNERLLFSVKINNNEFKLCNPFSKNILLKPTINNINIIKNKLWYVVNPLPKKNGNKVIGENEEYYLNEGDIFKIGSEIYFLTKINIKNYKKNNNIELLNFERKWIFETCSQTKILDKCQLCKHIIDELKEGKDLKNIHKINIIPTKNENVSTYKITLKICKICNKFFYPLRYKLTENSEIKELVHIEEPDDNKNYIRIESLEKMTEPYHKFIYIVKLTGEDEVFTFDSHGGDIPIYPNSIYKQLEKLYESAIKYNKREGKLSLENIGEKTGTMILIQNNYFNIPEKKEIYLQSGGTFFKAEIIDKEEYEKIEKEENNPEK